VSKGAGQKQIGARFARADEPIRKWNRTESSFPAVEYLPAVSENMPFISSPITIDPNLVVRSSVAIAVPRRTHFIAKKIKTLTAGLYL